MHFIDSNKKEYKYFPFAIRHENPWTDGTIRKDYLMVRVFPEDLQARARALTEGTPIRVDGALRSSRGSGELYLAALWLEVIEAQDQGSAG